MEICTCFKNTLTRLEEKIKEDLVENNVKYTDLKISWENEGYILGRHPDYSADYSPVNPRIKVEFRGFKRNGDIKSNITKEMVPILASYCCYCGRKLNKDNKIEE